MPEAARPASASYSLRSCSNSLSSVSLSFSTSHIRWWSVPGALLTLTSSSPERTAMSTQKGGSPYARAFASASATARRIGVGSRKTSGTRRLGTSPTAPATRTLTAGNACAPAKSARTSCQVGLTTYAPALISCRAHSREKWASETCSSCEAAASVLRVSSAPRTSFAASAPAPSASLPMHLSTAAIIACRSLFAFSTYVSARRTEFLCESLSACTSVRWTVIDALYTARRALCAVSVTSRVTET